jgi:CheY-like chemotaxis protein
MGDEKDRSETVEQYLKTGFLARVAHDIRGPSGVALTALDELETALGADAVTHASLFGIIRRSTRRVLRIAEKLTRATEAATGPLYQPGPVHLRAFVAKAARDAEGVEGRRTVALSIIIDGAGGADDIVEADASWLESLIIEVVANALKHARSKVTVTVERTESEAIVCIADDGRGPPTRLRALFEPSSERSGLGISLALADQFLRAQGGRLEIGPRPDGGTAVRLCLRAPRISTSTTASGNDGRASAASVKGRPVILVVDDDLDTVELVSFALDRAGFETVTAGSIADARRVLAEHTPAAVVTDLSLPDGSGSEIASLPGADRLRLKVIVSGHASDIVNREHRAEGFDRQLLKPIDLDELVKILATGLA